MAISWMKTFFFIANNCHYSNHVSELSLSNTIFSEKGMIYPFFYKLPNCEVYIRMNTKLSVGSISTQWKVKDSYICTEYSWSNQSFNICGRKTHFCNKITISSMVCPYILAWMIMIHVIDPTFVKGYNDYVIFWCALM